MSSNPLTPQELLTFLQASAQQGYSTPQFPAKYVFATDPLTLGSPAFRLFDAAYISTGIIDPNRLGTGSTGLGNLYLADDGTWKVISAGGGGDMLKATYDVDNDGIVDSAERIQILVRNSTGSTLTKGTVVYLSGATGNRPNAVKAQANTEATSSKTFGIVVANITNNSDGYVACNGTLHDLDTSAFTAGDAVWLSAATAGAYTSTIPSEPNHTVFIGYIARSHPTQGRLVILIQNGYELNELHGVLIASEANNELLTYESSTGLWKNKTFSAIFGGTPLTTIPTLAQVTTAGNTTANAITVGGLTVNTNLIYTDTVNGRVGIGTASPSERLHIRQDQNGATQIRVENQTNGTNSRASISIGSAGDAITIARYLSNYTTISGWANKGAVITDSGLTNGFFFRTAAGPISFQPAGTTDRVIFTDTGNVLIGTTTDAGYKLDVNGTARINSSLYITDPSFTGEGRIYQAANNTTVIVGRVAGASENITFGPSNRIFINASQSRFPNGSVQIASTLTLGNSGNATSTNMLLMQGSITAGSALGRGIGMDTTLVAAANNDVLVGLDINPTFTNGAFTGVTNIAARFGGNVLFTEGPRTISIAAPAATGNGGALTISAGNATTAGQGGNISIQPGNGAGGPGAGTVIISNTSWWNGATVNGTLTVTNSGPNTGTSLQVNAGGQNGLTIYWDNLTPFMQYGLVSARQARFVNSSSYSFSNNLLVGTTTDSGYKLDVNGTFRAQGSITATLASTSTASVVYYNSSTGLLTYGTAPIGAQFVIDYDPNITGTKNGVNLLFTTSATFIATTTRVFLNGQRLSRGATYDYVETGTNQITFAAAPLPTDQLIIEYQI